MGNWECEKHNTFMDERSTPCPYCELAKLQSALEWACIKLIEMRTRYGNGGFTTDELEKLIGIVGIEKFNKASEPPQYGSGVWGE